MIKYELQIIDESDEEINYFSRINEIENKEKMKEIINY